MKPNKHFSITDIKELITLFLLCLATEFVAFYFYNPYKSQHYEPKTLISMKWGSAPQEFGLIDEPEEERIGPYTFTVDKKGNIYILDTVNNHIKKFSENGVFLGIIGDNLPGYSFAVRDDQIYVLNGEFVYRYSQSGELQEKYSISHDIQLFEGYGQWMRIDDLGNLYIKSRFKSYQICKGVMGKTVVLSDEEQVKSEKIGSPNTKGDRWFRIDRRDKNKAIVHMMDNIENEFLTIPVDTSDVFGVRLFLDQDERGSIFIEAQRIDTENCVHLEVRKFDNMGHVLSLIKVPGKYYTTVYKKVAVDYKGNVYQLLTRPEGVKVIKWEPK